MSKLAAKRYGETLFLRSVFSYNKNGGIFVPSVLEKRKRRYRYAGANDIVHKRKHPACVFGGRRSHIIFTASGFYTGDQDKM